MYKKRASRIQTAAQLRAAGPQARRTFFATAPDELIEEITEPCRGEAHSNAYIDNCGMCLGYTWGRVPKRECAACGCERSLHRDNGLCTGGDNVHPCACERWEP